MTWGWHKNYQASVRHTDQVEVRTCGRHRPKLLTAQVDRLSPRTTAPGIEPRATYYMTSLHAPHPIKGDQCCWGGVQWWCGPWGEEDSQLRWVHSLLSNRGNYCIISCVSHGMMARDPVRPRITMICGSAPWHCVITSYLLCYSGLKDPCLAPSMPTTSSFILRGHGQWSANNV